MKNSSPKQLSIYIAFLSIVIIIVFVLLIASIDHRLFWIIFIPGIVLLFFLFFIIIQTFLNRLIIDRINPIYKTIHNVNISQKELKENFKNKDVFTKVKSDVINWAQKRKNEISELKQMENYRKEFIGNVMHELKTPIFNIQGYVLTLIDGGLEDPSINREYLERTEKSVNRLISIVEDLESISRLESGKLILEMTHFDIRKVIEESFEIHEMMAKALEIKLKFDKSYEKAIMVYADRDRLLEVVNNLVANSIKYGKKGGKTLISFHDMDQNILVEITDDGIGIEEDKIPRLFERFYRVDKGRSREQGGTGLGLSIVKHILEAHHQTINVRSRLHEGSSFAFTIQKGITKPGKSAVLPSIYI